MSEVREVDYGESCRDCGRLLVTVYKNGTFDLAGKARVSMRIRLDDLVQRGTAVGEPDPGTAVCFLWSCRIKRWWRSQPWTSVAQRRRS